MSIELTLLFIQTLVELILPNNDIGDIGAEALADVLRDNTVTFF